MDRRHRIEVAVAVVAAIGAIAVAVISNVDKFRSDDKGEPTAESNHYAPTNDIETEIRHQVEITGLREAVQAMKARLETKYKEKYNLSGDEVACIMDTSFFGNEYIDIFVDVHKKHMTLEEVQELNRFYSSDVMINYRRKQAVIVQEFMEEMDRLAEKKYKTLKTLTASSRSDDKSHAQACPPK